MKLIESSPNKVKTTVQSDDGTPSSRSSRKTGLRKLMHKMGSRKSKKLIQGEDQSPSSKKKKFCSFRSDMLDTNSQSSTSSLSDDATAATPTKVRQKSPPFTATLKGFGNSCFLIICFASFTLFYLIGTQSYKGGGSPKQPSRH